MRVALSLYTATKHSDNQPKARVVQQSGKMTENLQTLGPNSIVTLEGKLVLETKNLTKEQIVSLGPVIDSVLIS